MPYKSSKNKFKNTGLKMPANTIKGVKKPHFEIKKEDSQSEKFKKTMQWLMEDRNISEAEVARLTNVSPATIHRLIYGITDPRLTTLRSIASFFRSELNN